MRFRARHIIPIMDMDIPNNRSLPLTVLVVDDEEWTLRTLTHLLAGWKLQVLPALNLDDARAHLATAVPDIAIVDVYVGEEDGLAFAGELRRRLPEIGILVISKEDTEQLARMAIEAGADNFVSKPVSKSALRLNVDRLAELRRERERSRQFERDLKHQVMSHVFPGIVTHSDAMRAVLRLVEKVGQRDLSVLVYGESGTGKDLVARAIHHLSSRSRCAFVELNCAALPPNLVESELFGHEKGAFTGAVVARAGKIEQANGGTLFLDEIGELPLEIQPKLLRALQDKRITRVGGKGGIACDFRLVCATNRDLVEEVRAGRFREDLFYRVSVFPIKLPPLRERMEDLELLLTHFLKQEGASHLRFSKGALDLLHGYGWPGNVRELKNFVQAVTLLAEANLVEDSVVAEYFGSRLDLGGDLRGGGPATAAGTRPVRKLADLEREEIEYALRTFDGNIPEAARALGMGRATLYKWLKKNAQTEDAVPAAG